MPVLADGWGLLEPLLHGRTEGKIFGVYAFSVSTSLTRACQALDPPILDLHFHDLRHRATSQFFRMGLDMPRVALMTGYKTWAMSRRYTNITPEDVHAPIAELAPPVKNIRA